ncbi:MAG: flavodoxin family protein [Euryarchaeota archaeon]|nr:flavodoxin family protein [Euryarchaeota archaeon]
MSYAIVYYSHFGNGKKIVERLAAQLKGEVKVLTLSEASPKAMPPADTYVFSAPAEAFSLHRGMKRFLKDLEGTNGRKCALVNTHASRKSRIPKMEELAAKKGMQKVAELDYQVTGDYRNGNGLPEGWEKKLDEFAGKI